MSSDRLVLLTPLRQALEVKPLISKGQLQAYGAITGRRKLPWRYRWPDAVRDGVLARLLALNAKRYAEEEALGLHSKGGGEGGHGRHKRKAQARPTSKPRAQSRTIHFEVTQ